MYHGGGGGGGLCHTFYILAAEARAFNPSHASHTAHTSLVIAGSPDS